ncbi:LemA family protein [Niveibacterium sp. SC-1]|uniref:LemA family protein n=1 Tax=Niveibacterium sp. SC-1 TaxID=3135646 RepID=UPI00311E53B2
MKYLKLSRLLLVAALVTQLGACGYGDLHRASADVDRAWLDVRHAYEADTRVAADALEVAQREPGMDHTAMDAANLAYLRANATPLDLKLAGDPQAFDQFKRTRAELTGALHRLLAEAKKHPALQGKAAIAALERNLREQDSQSQARVRYSESVTRYNTLLSQFPERVTGKLLGFDPRPQFVRTAEGVS